MWWIKRNLEFVRSTRPIKYRPKAIACVVFSSSLCSIVPIDTRSNRKSTRRPSYIRRFTLAGFIAIYIYIYIRFVFNRIIMLCHSSTNCASFLLLKAISQFLLILFNTKKNRNISYNLVLSDIYIYMSCSSIYERRIVMVDFADAKHETQRKHLMITLKVVLSVLST